MFRVLRRDEQRSNAFAILKKMLTTFFNRVGSLAHALDKCLHHRAERKNINIENNVNKIYHYISIYTDRSKQLKEYCEFENCECRKLLSHGKACWVFLSPGTTRLIKML